MHTTLSTEDERIRQKFSQTIGETAINCVIQDENLVIPYQSKS